MSDDVLLLVLPESGAALLVWPDGRAVRVERDGVTIGRIEPVLKSVNGADLPLQARFPIG